MLVPWIGFPLVLLARNLRQASKTAQEKVADLAVVAEESVSGIRSVHAFSQELFIESKFKDGLSLLKLFFFSKNPDQDWHTFLGVLLNKAEKSQAEKAVVDFITPNKSMYSIFGS